MDPLTHGRKTIAGIDLTSGATTTTPCGKRRPAARTSADPARVSCPQCRAWAANEERELAQRAVAVGRLVREYPDLSPYSPADFASLANDHDARAERWGDPA
jgi:hypothetical protein